MSSHRRQEPEIPRGLEAVMSAPLRPARVARGARSGALLLALASLAASGCSGTARLVHEGSDASWSEHRTYGFADAGGDGEGPLHAALQAAAAREMEARGFGRASDPDLLVQLVPCSRRVLDTVPDAYPVAVVRPTSDTEWAAGYRQPLAPATEVALLLQVADARQRTVVWEAARIVRSTPALRGDVARAADEAVAEIFESFPLAAEDADASASTSEADAADEHAGDEDPDAMVLLAALLEEGQAGAPDVARAARWYRRAAERGQATAQARLGLLCLQGRGVPQDDREARRWLALASEHGVPHARHALARMLLEGRGGPSDDGRAARLLRLAAEQGLAAAQVDLALLCLRGRGVSTDADEAYRWTERAALQGHARALRRMGHLTERGLGVARSERDAYVWYSLAESAGDDVAAARRAALARSLPTEAIEAAEGRASAWRPEPTALTLPAASARTSAWTRGWPAGS